MSEAEALAQAGEAALAEERLGEAVALLDRAEAAGALPDRCAGDRWLAHMLAGDFEAAWRESDAIRGRGAPDPHRFWMGEPWRGKRVILRSLHGFGDAVQMFRFLPRLRESCRELTVEVPPRLVGLAPYFDGMGQVITWGEQAPPRPPVWDVQCEVMELPYMLRVTTAELEPRQGYLHVPEAVQARVTTVLGPTTRPRVGVVWTAGHWNPSRSVPFAALQGLAAVGGVEFWSLESRGERDAGVALPAGWRDVYEVGDGILPMAGLIAQLDLVVTVDTLAAHLAGALGVPCWLMLQHRADWRWMSGRVDSPWYPLLRLWRCGAGESWGGLLKRVAGGMTEWLEEQRAE